MLEDDKVAFGVGLEVGVLGYVGDGGAPESFEVARDFRQSIWRSSSAGFIFHERDGFHQVGHGDDVVVCDGDIDGCGGGAVRSFLDEERRARGFVFEGVNHDLTHISTHAQSPYRYR